MINITSTPLFLFLCHTSYKYISLLVVGRGGDRILAWDHWSSFYLAGGTTGQIAYVPNILISDILGGAFPMITFETNYNSSSLDYGTFIELTLSSNNETYCLIGYNGFTGGDKERGAYLDTMDSYKVHYGKSSGAVASHYGTIFKCSGSYGSKNASEGKETVNGIYMRPDGAAGGDGVFGFKSSYEESTYRTYPIMSAVSIPIQSIFGGTSVGHNGYLNTGSGQRTGASAPGGAGYGDSGAVGEAVRTPGYGCGRDSSPADEDVGNTMNPGAGIVCLYYHNDPI